MSINTNKSVCKYGHNCYRRNPLHFQEFDHPFDYKTRLNMTSNDDKSDNNTTSMSSQEESNKKLKTSHNSNDNQNDNQIKTIIDSNVFGFYLTKVNGIDDKFNELKSNSINLKEILSESMGRLIESVQFNYMFEVDWLLEQYPKQFRSLPLLLVYGNKRDGKATKEMQIQSNKYRNIKLFGVQIHDMFGTHHTKMMFLRYDCGLRVVIHTANLIARDWDQKTQGVWMSPIFKPLAPNQTTADVSQTSFKTDLLEYLDAYSSKEIDYWSQLIKRHDLSSAKVFLVGSVPGRHIQDNKSKFGHLKLRKILNSFGPSTKNVDSSWPLIAQFSSIGSLGPTAESWLTSEFLISLSTDCSGKLSLTKPQLKLIFTSVEDVRNSLEGYIGGASLPYSAKTASKQTYLQSYLHSWKSELRGRTNACPHIKSYSRYSPDLNEMSWFLLTSANLSKAAWGVLEKNSSQLAIKSYEMGVLFIPKIFGTKEVFNVSKIGDRDESYSFPVPYDIPLTPYKTNDKPWTWDEPHTDKPDRHGNAWIPS